MIKSGYRVPPIIANIIDTIVDLNELNSSQRYNLLRAIIGYVLSVHDFNEMKRCIGSFVSAKDVSRIRIASIQNFDLIVRFKHATYLCLQAHRYERKEVFAFFESFGLERRNARLFFLLQDLELYEPALEKLKTAVGPFLTPERVQHHCKNLVMFLTETAHVEKFVKKKHAFIIKHNNYQVDDVVYDLMAWGISSYYLSIPFRSYPHTVNFVKASIHSRGINLIDYNTSQKRSRLSKDGVKQVSLSVENPDGASFEKDVSDSKEIADNENEMVLRISITALLKKYDGKRRQVIKLLMHRNLTRFLDFVIKRENRLFDSVEEYKTFCRTQEKFLEVVREYVGVSPDRFYDFLEEIKTELGGR